MEDMELSNLSSNEPQQQSDPPGNSVSRSQANEQAFSLFSFADKFDCFLMIFGSIGACVHGAALPIFFLLFGRLINLLGSLSADPQKLASEVSKHALQLVYLGLLVMATAWIGTSLAIVPLVAVAGGTYTIIMSSLSRKGEAAYAEAGKVAEEVLITVFPNRLQLSSYHFFLRENLALLELALLDLALLESRAPDVLEL